MNLRRVCVFCGSSKGNSPRYAEAGKRFGELLAQKGLGVVYGGGHVGLMGVVADAALSAGGEVIGVIPRRLQERELAHAGLTKLHVVETMHERKALMADLSDAFVALPGGIGTYEELFEVATWAMLGIHQKPVAVLNVRGYYDPFVRLLEQAVNQGFLGAEHHKLIDVHTDPEALVSALESFQPLPVDKWLDRSRR